MPDEVYSLRGKGARGRVKGPPHLICNPRVCVTSRLTRRDFAPVNTLAIPQECKTLEPAILCTVIYSDTDDELYND